MFSFSAAVAEMLIQSTTNDFYLLPALPRDKWGSGSVKGLRARGNVTVSIEWNAGDLHEFSVWSSDKRALGAVENEKFTKSIHYKEMSVVTTMSKGKVYTFDKQLRLIRTSSLLNPSSI